VVVYSAHTGQLPAALDDLTSATPVNGVSAGPFINPLPCVPTGWTGAGACVAGGNTYAYAPAAGGTFTVSATGDGTTVTVP
jgi:hypothetical protein